MEGKGTRLICKECGKSYEMGIYGRLKAAAGETEFPHIPHWFAWQREHVRRQIIEKAYRMEWDVEIGILTDYKALYMVGGGKLVHDMNGFHLISSDGKIDYTQKPAASYSLNADYYWYEIGDVICIGNKDRLYYCFPKKQSFVTKARFAAEELYKLAHIQKSVER